MPQVTSVTLNAVFTLILQGPRRGHYQELNAGPR